MATTSVWKHRFFIARRMTAGTVYRVLGKANKLFQSKHLFSIKPGYHHASHVEAFDDTRNKDEWQRKVYELAESVAKDLDNPSVIDVGCGSGYKLVHMLGKYNTTGIEVEPAYSWLQKQYPDRKWLLFNSTDPATLHADVVICSDVIEHIENPDTLMSFLAAIQFKYLIISTPEREIIRGRGDYGPPQNAAHFREWNAAEFENYVQSWFTIKKHHIVNDKSISQVVICTKTV
jgi:SAM-dependent methyltransferase